MTNKPKLVLVTPERYPALWDDIRPHVPVPIRRGSAWFVEAGEFAKWQESERAKEGEA